MLHAFQPRKNLVQINELLNLSKQKKRIRDQSWLMRFKYTVNTPIKRRFLEMDLTNLYLEVNH